ncbi:hypothetical protein [Candidatus Poriferisodalis sp.]|uniref:hypothetical protein n=1 Tax=Candidatus Poriferisodalis sp. TaxID=3101277 RepID=UPI003B02050F
MTKAWNYDLPGQEHIDDAATWAKCFAFVMAFGKAKGKAAQVTGIKAAVAGLGCEKVIEHFEIDDSDPDADSDSGDSPSGDGDDDSSGEGDDPSLEGSWRDVVERHAPVTNDEQRALYKRYMCQKYDDFPPGHCQ